MSCEIRQGDWIEVLKTLPSGSVHMVCTSPPYWGLRDYGVAGQLGLERTPEEYVTKVVEGFRELRRVLRDDGTCWVNLGDSYATGAGSGRSMGGDCFGKQNKVIDSSSYPACQPNRMPIAGLKPKDLVGVPWMVAFALRGDGWYLRSEIIWHKRNPMPESVADRPTKSHEQIFLLAKSERYYYDADAIAEPLESDPDGWGRHSKKDPGLQAVEPRPMFGPGRDDRNGTEWGNRHTRNKRDVWTVNTSPFPEAHFATFPPEIPEICIKAGCPEGETVLDPFCGAGTTGMVAKRLMRSFIGIELNPQYVEMARKRIVQDAPLFNEVTTQVIEEPACSAD